MFMRLVARRARAVGSRGHWGGTMGNRATWKVTCEGGMSGTGDITYQPDSYQGTMTVTMDQGSMKMDLSGRRTGKACDAEEVKKTIERAQKQADDVGKAQADAMAAI